MTLRQMHYCSALILLWGVAVAAFQPAHRCIFRICCSHPSVLTTLHARAENEALKAELSDYLRKREDVNADAAAKT